MKVAAVQIDITILEKERNLQKSLTALKLLHGRARASWYSLNAR